MKAKNCQFINCDKKTALKVKFGYIPRYKVYLCFKSSLFSKHLKIFIKLKLNKIKRQSYKRNLVLKIWLEIYYGALLQLKQSYEIT